MYLSGVFLPNGASAPTVRANVSHGLAAAVPQVLTLPTTRHMLVLSGVNGHLSSAAVCTLLTRAGYEPVFQISCRDRSRISIQSDLLGAAATGARNVLCLASENEVIEHLRKTSKEKKCEEGKCTCIEIVPAGIGN